MLYKGVYDAAHPPEGDPAESWALSASILPLLDNTGWGQSQQQINAVDLVPGDVFVYAFHMIGLDTR